MRGEHEIVDVAVRPLGGRRLDLEDVEGGTSDLAALKSLGEDIFIDETAAGAVDDANAFLEEGKLLGSDHVLGFLGEGHVHGDEVCAGKDILNLLDHLDLE